MADLSSLPATQTGIKPDISLNDIGLSKGMAYLEGYINVPKDSTYQFSMSGNGSSLLRLHETLLLDHSYPDQPALNVPLSATVNLKAGYHPFRLYVHHAGKGKPRLNWMWQSDEIPWQSIPSTALFHAVER